MPATALNLARRCQQYHGVSFGTVKNAAEFVLCAVNNTAQFVPALATMLQSGF
jgi:hypothetical protein